MKAERRKFAVQLSDFEAPEVCTYSLESTIAEKFDAILQRFELTSRLKDFYDIYYLAKNFDFDGIQLQTALTETLQNRGTLYEKDSFEHVILLADDADMQSKWRYFLKNIKGESLELRDSINGIEVFLRPVYDAIISEREWLYRWDSVIQTWN